jgi:hypothetical protein
LESRWLGRRRSCQGPAAACSLLYSPAPVHGYTVACIVHVWTAFVKCYG